MRHTFTSIIAAIAIAFSTISCSAERYDIEPMPAEESPAYVMYKAVSADSTDIMEISTLTSVGVADFKSTAEFEAIIGPVDANTFEPSIEAVSQKDAEIKISIYISEDLESWKHVGGTTGEAYAEVVTKISE